MTLVWVRHVVAPPPSPSSARPVPNRASHRPRPLRDPPVRRVAKRNLPGRTERPHPIRSLPLSPFPFEPGRPSGLQGNPPSDPTLGKGIPTHRSESSTVTFRVFPIGSCAESDQSTSFARRATSKARRFEGPSTETRGGGDLQKTPCAPEEPGTPSRRSEGAGMADTPGASLHRYVARWTVEGKRGKNEPGEGNG